MKYWCKTVCLEQWSGGIMNKKKLKISSSIIHNSITPTLHYSNLVMVLLRNNYAAGNKEIHWRSEHFFQQQIFQHSANSPGKT